MVQAHRVTIRLFGGEGSRVQQEVNDFLASRGRYGNVDYELVSIKYNYQASEVDREGEIVAPATHGVCIVLAEAKREPHI